MYSLKKRLTFVLLFLFLITGTYQLDAYSNYGYGQGTSVTGVPMTYSPSRLYNYGIRDPNFLSGGNTFRNHYRSYPYYYDRSYYPNYYNTYSYPSSYYDTYPSIYDQNRMNSPYNRSTRYIYYKTQPQPEYETYYIIVPANE